jgi:hypothetical protein
MRNGCPIATGPGVDSKANMMSELPCGGRVAQNSILRIWTVLRNRKLKIKKSILNIKKSTLKVKNPNLNLRKPIHF